MTVSVPCLTGECRACAGTVVINHAPWPCECVCHSKSEREAA